MAAEFDWWLLIVGLAVGAGLTWLVVAESRRREEDLVEADLPLESEWIAGNLATAGMRADQATVEETLRLHRAWLALPPPELPEPAEESGERGREGSGERMRDDAPAPTDRPA